ncbi:FAD-dependent oxidoreductase [Nitratireductor kimnyeongensis]|uniref:FAD-dependent oxidoreductase n=1 Tax=Nitratireductor kimnyeongensis TaxID=430679 RepID=A0ABW0T814_9HYPH|nr:FAD-dependent monooxygenase [Nitratireductor kimnyeongensis]QZZ36160.1 FAD-dependent monooxygenase [Nitratireductor kimnyeongensis]
MSGVESKPVIIVGAGPTGLALAARLGMDDVPCILLEAEPDLTVDLRAGSFHPPTIEMLTELGIGETMHREAIKVPVWQVRDRIAGVVAEFDLSLLSNDTPYPYRLHLEQHRLTPILLDRIRKDLSSVEIRFDEVVTEVAQDDGGVTVKTANGETLRGAFLVGCDGARSVVRAAMKVDFAGFTWPERFLVASTTFDLGEWGFAGAGYIADPDNWAAVFIVPDDGPPGLWRIAYGTDPAIPDEQVMAPASIQERLGTIMEHAGHDAEPFPLKYASTYRVHQRVATRFTEGRILLAGDAAHLNNPLGGFGLNGSVHDAVNLGGKLVEIYLDGAPHEDLFDLYDRQRRPVNIRAVQSMSIRNKKLLEERDPDVRAAEQRRLREIAANPETARAYLLNSSMINSVREAAAVKSGAAPMDVPLSMTKPAAK